MNEFAQCYNFTEYMDLLQKYKEQYTIVLAVKDALANVSPSQPWFHHPKALFDSFAEIGFACNLYGSFRRSYAAVLEYGVPVFEVIAVDEKHPVEFQNSVFHVLSEGFLCGNRCSIRIHDVEYAVNGIGLNIVVYDEASKSALDSVAVNMLREQIVMTRNTKTSLLANDRFQLDFIHAAGYSLAMYCKENQINSLSVFLEAEKRHEFTFELLHFILIDIGMVKWWLSDADFTVRLDLYKSVRFQTFQSRQFSKDDTVIVLGRMNPAQTSVVFGKANVRELGELLPKVYRYVTWERHLLEFQNRHPNVTLVTAEFPAFPRNDLSENELRILRGKEQDRLQDAIDENYRQLGYSPSAVRALLYRPKSRVMENDSYYFDDYQNEYIHIQNGHRAPPPRLPKTGNSEKARRIFFVGECFLFGYGSDDANTIEAHLQAEIDRNNLDWIVENYGMFCWGVGDNSYKKLFDLPVKDGDIVLTNILRKPLFSSNPHLNLSALFQRPHSYGDNLFIDFRLHYNQDGNRVIAGKIFAFLLENKFFIKHENQPSPVLLPPRFGIREISAGTAGTVLPPAYPGLETYKARLAKLRKRIGAIVMNCNPFTLGHRYLIETAAGQCLHLYVFVVEEDKSVFRFEDRLELVRKGTQDLSNVTVLPSGQFIISQLTFEEYFGKSEMQDRTIDPSFDVRLFGEQIAPVLGITARFAGEEPLDNVTRQYNEAMREILPKYGVAFVEIPRMQADGGVISASRVRKLLKEKDFDGIAKLVPPSTLDFLKERYGGRKNGGA